MKYFEDDYRKKIRLKEINEKIQEKKKRNRTYLKGQRGVRRYYDYDKAFAEEYDYEEDKPEDERQIKCVFTKDLRRQKLFAYLKYLKGRKILVRDLAWKFAVTERTIQHDLRFLEENGFIKTQINKTLKGKMTKNSYIVNKNKEKDLPFENTYLGVCFIVKKDDGIYVLTETNYKAKELAVTNFKPMNDCYFRLPQVKLKLEKRIDEKSFNVATKILGSKFEKEYNGLIYFGYYDKKTKRIDYENDCKPYIEHRKTKIIFTWFLLTKSIVIPKGFMWIKLDKCNRKIKHTLVNKCLSKIKDVLG